MSFFEGSDSPADNPKEQLSQAASAYQAMEVRNHAERTIRAAGRSASPDFLKAIAAEIVAQANAKGAAR